ncbi:MAG: heat-inducible transcription repressor HrcA [Chloroflexi bacterium]|nr:heat-inducible transcription repressor HrcA [Chloroflexota bacterium]MBI3732106.1 heat-inducible transcription repressor HrcA [Chloroflexota bacterium]
MPIDLTGRQQFILAQVVQNYVTMATPIGSELIAQRMPMRTSSATVRNEMAALEELGYLMHPHTSAGRVPTAKGYRYFVERLMEQSDLTEAEKRTIQHQFHQAHLDLEQWMRLAAAVVSHTAQSTALVTAPKSPQSYFKHLELLAISENLILVLLVLRDGTVKQQMTATPQPAPAQEELSVLSAQLNAHLAGLNARGVSALMAEAHGLEAQVLDRVATIMYQIDHRGNLEIYRDGLSLMLQQPEFKSGSHAERLMHMLEAGTSMERLLDEAATANGVQIVIGGDERWSDMRDVSLILARYGGMAEATGVVAVLGPLRMSYGRAISTVRFVASVMDGLVEWIYK